MKATGLPWASALRPRALKEIVGNERAVKKFVDWARSWEKGIPSKRAAFLYGPPGIGKTSVVLAVAEELGFDMLEVNASDYRTGKRLESLIGRSSAQSLTVLGRRRLILIDELEGISGREDEGGISAISQLIKETRTPVVLVATTVSESWEEKFAPLREGSLLIEFGPVPFEGIVGRLGIIAREAGISVEDEVLERISERSNGDLRSAINDFEAVSKGRKVVTLGDLDWLGDRDRQTYTPDSLMKIFSAKTLREARQVLDSSYIGYDDLFDWISENLPFVLDDPSDLASGLDALSRADIHESRAKRADYRLLKYMMNEMTGGVALSRGVSEGFGVMRQVRRRLMAEGLAPNAFTISDVPEGIAVKPVRYLGNDWRRINSSMREMGGNWSQDGGFWFIPYFHPPQLIWRLRRTWHSRRMRGAVVERLAAASHVSKKEALREIVPMMNIIVRGSDSMGKEIADWLDLDEKEFSWLKS